MTKTRFRCTGFLGLLLIFGCRSAPEVPKEGYLTGSEGARLFYRVVGRGTDTVVVIHGGPGAGMNAVLPDFGPLADQHTVVYFDQRGGGRSELPADTSLLSAAHFVEDVEAVRRFFGLDRMNVVAHSFGSIIVARYAQEYPDRLGHIIFMAATGPRRSTAGAHARAFYEKADSTLLQSLFEPLSKLLDGTAEDPVETCREFHEAGKALAESQGLSTAGQGSECQMPPEPLRYYFHYTAQVGPRSFGDWDFTNDLGAVTAPLLVIYGDADTTALSMQRAWAAAVPEGRLLVVPDAGKAAHADRPGLVFAAVDTFLSGKWPAQSRPITR